MKAIAYSIRNNEKVSLAKANSKKHDFLFISNALNEANLIFAIGKDVLILYKLDTLTLGLLERIKEIGIKLIISRDHKPSLEVLQLATQVGIPITHVQCNLTDEKKAHQIINILDYVSKGLQESKTSRQRATDIKSDKQI
ncbi:Rossmann-fold NAD(P)-binding domain-containing protein [Albibacterium indicum]|uniref:hypothetical protein n=1 Tax=Albibacterium indicum TaxID=2292082 RepID=UPI000E532343|nr:hypothetical protein [Pedobacter indicus]